MKLTDVQIRNAKYDPNRKTPLRLSDGGGLSVEIKKNKKVWRYDYLKPGNKTSKTKMIFGEYPTISLAEARRRLAEAKEQLANGINPAEEKQRQKRALKASIENTFGAIGWAWFNLKSPDWSEDYRDYIDRMFKRDVMPAFENRPITEITSTEILTFLKEIEDRPAPELAKKTRQRMSEVFRYAKAVKVATEDPTTDLSPLMKKRESKHYPHLLERDLPAFLKAASNYGGDFLTVASFRMLMLTGVRTIDIRKMEWSEINFDDETWFLSGEKRSKKGERKRSVTIALSKQSIDILKEVRKLSGKYKYVFPNRNDPNKIRSENTITKMIAEIGYKGRMTGHGFRHTLSTILNERGYNSDWIEMQLAHVDGNNIRGIYNHAAYLEGRRKMMQWYADHIDSLEHDENVVYAAFGNEKQSVNK
ncbi:tyrosine-type recombinase/integrase [Salmonella enterica]|nr:tyrosine-type recombinase/integrase [Salmonella enterica]